MTRLEELLARWDAGQLTAAEVEELKTLLSTPEGRAGLVEEWRFNETLYDTFHTRLATVPSASPRVAHARAAVASPVSPAAKPRQRWLIWREFHFRLSRLALLGEAGCLAILVLWLYCELGAAATVADARAGATIHRRGRDVPAVDGQALYPGDVISASGTGTVTVAWPGEATTLVLSPGSKLELSNPFRGKRLGLPTGALGAGVAPQSWLRPMLIRTPGAEARVVGTRFSLSATGLVSRLGVVEGAVRFRKTQITSLDRERQVLVSAGHTSTAAPDAPLGVAWLTGFLSRDAWLTPEGTALTDAPRSGTALLLETPVPPAASGSEVVERLRGYLLAPTTGDFVFWVASHRGASPVELWLSPDDKPTRKRRIALEAPVANGVAPRGNSSLRLDFSRSPEQQSAPQPLESGRRYYLEVWHTGLDIQTLGLAWRLPDQPASTPPTMVDLNTLCPFVETTAKN